jgi:hypothetical protein
MTTGQENCNKTTVAKNHESRARAGHLVSERQDKSAWTRPGESDGQNMTEKKGQMGQDNRERTAVEGQQDGKLGQHSGDRRGQLELVREDRSAWQFRPVRSCLTEPGQDSHNMSLRT